MGFDRPNHGDQGFFKIIDENDKEKMDLINSQYDQMMEAKRKAGQEVTDADIFQSMMIVEATEVTAQERDMSVLN